MTSDLLTGTPSIALPQWYACFPRDTRMQRGGAEARRIGPLDVYRNSEGCEVATFGRSDDPGVALFDGYLFDRTAMRHELGLPPDAADAQIAAAAYERWSLGALDRLDGSYLVVIWDPRERALLVGHDALGHHPVFFAETDGNLWITSNVLALPSAGAVPRRPNRVSLGRAALLYWPATGETFFESVRRLRPGHYLRAPVGGGLQEVRYWSPWLDDGDPGMEEKEAREQFEPTLMDAIARCMELAPDGILLSGGLDSVTIAALAADYSRAHGAAMIRAVSGRRDHTPAAEEPMQSAVAGALRMDHLVAAESEWMRGRSSVDMSLDVLAELPGPSRIYWVGAYIAFYRFVAAHSVHTALTGSGGDNWVSVVDAFAAHAMRRFDLRGLVQHMRSWTGTGGMSVKGAAHHLLWSGGLRLLLDSYSARWMPSLKERYHQRRAIGAIPSWLCPDAPLREALADTLYAQRPAALTRDGHVPRNFYRHAQRSTTNPYFQYEFEVGFHVESMCGLRLLSPYHDKRVVRFLNSIPPEMLLQGQSYKGMLRPIAEARLPKLGLASQRKVYGQGVQSAQAREFLDGVRAIWPVHPLDRLGSLGVVDPDAARAALVASDGMTFDEAVTMYALMSAERWLAVHGGH
jgi:asparagine synthetase B (glutamine-hydrolysing)